MKRCTKCNNYFDISLFCKDKTKPDGLHPWCKKCRISSTTGWQKANKDKVNINAKNWRSENRNVVRERARILYRNNAEKNRKRSSDYKKKNPEKIKDYKKSYYLVPENRKRELEREKEWRKRTGKSREYDLRRRSRKASLPNTLTKEEWNQILFDFKGSCAYCRKDGKMVVEHLIPLSRNDIVNNPGTVKENIVPSCRSCNSSKHNKTHYEWCNENQLRYIQEIKRGVLS